MTKTEIQKIATEQDGAATAKLIAELQTADFDTAADLIARLVTAARRDEADDIYTDLRAERMTEAADLVKSNYLV